MSRKPGREALVAKGLCYRICLKSLVSRRKKGLDRETNSVSTSHKGQNQAAMTDFLEKECHECKNTFSKDTVFCPHDGSILSTTLAVNPSGHMLGDRYELVQEIGRGGMGVIYKGLDRQEPDKTRATVAIKLLISDAAQDPVMRNRFINEARAASAMNHPNIVAVREYNVTSEGLAFIVMDFLEGMVLQDLIDTGVLPPEQMLTYMIQVCDALSHAHKRNVIHRDIKPSNIMITGSGEATKAILVDFGIAKIFTQPGQVSMRLTQTGQIFGSPMYMSPEQCMGQKLDNRSDIYSMGCVLYEYAAGRPPFDGESFIQIIFAHINQEAPTFATDALNRVLESVIMKAIEKSPDDRFSDMDELKDQLAYCHALWTRDDIDNYSDYVNTIAPQIAASNLTSLEQAALDGDLDAQLDLAHYYHEEEAPHYAPEKAFEWALKAATADLANAQAFVGDCFSQGIGTTEDQSKAFYWYSKAALAGHSGAERKIGEMYLSGNVVAQDLDVALYWLRRSCEHDDIDSQIYLAERLNDGEIFDADLEESTRWYRAAALLGSVEAQIALARCYKYGTGVEKNEAESVYWLKHAVEQYSAEAMANLAEYYHLGTGVKKDDTEALRLMQDAAKLGNGTALKWLGWWYSQGLAKLPVDQKRAIKYYKEAVEAGDTSAMYYLGWHYQNGTGVEQSNTAAVYWYKKGAKLDNLECIGALGCCYRDGLGVRIDRLQAHKLLTDAATANDAEAQFNLALMEREDGHEESANYWFKLAAANGIDEANDYLI